MLRGVMLACLAAALAAPARAQDEKEAANRCAERDEVGAPPNRVPHAPLAVFMAEFFAAPSVLLLRKDAVCTLDDNPVGFWRDHVVVHATGGGAFTGSRGGGMHSEGVEVLMRGAYAEFRNDQFYFADRTRMWDVRAGYLIHPVRGAAGGITVGWREVKGVPGGWSGGGALVAFPIMMSACSDRGTASCWIWWEPAYLVSDRGLGFAPRLRLEVPLARTPFVGRIDMEAKGMKKKDPLSVMVGFALRP